MNAQEFSGPYEIRWSDDKFPQMYITIEYLDDWCLPESISTL